MPICRIHIDVIVAKAACGIRNEATRRNEEKRKGREKREETSNALSREAAVLFSCQQQILPAISAMCPVLSRLARMKNRSRPPAENVELQLPSTEAVIRWYRRTLDAPRHKSLIFTRRWRCRGCARGSSRCHGANKYGPIDRRVREEERKKKGGSPRPDKCWPPGATRVRRPRRTINTPRTVSRIIKE